MSAVASPSELSGVVLVIEASTSSGSLALLERGLADSAWQVRGSVEVPMGSGRDDSLTPAVSALLATSGCSVRELSAVVCGSGPGSFTSLRIASALAKGLAFGAELPLYAIPSLLLAGAADRGPEAPGRMLVTLDALRDECYAQPVELLPSGFVQLAGPASRLSRDAVAAAAEGARLLEVDTARGVVPTAVAARWCVPWRDFGPFSLDEWEPAYGRLAEAQVKWETAHGRPLPRA